MEALAVDWSFALPLLFTVLAVLLASAFVKLRSSGAEKEEKEKEKEGEEEAHANAASGEVGEPREAEARTVPPAAAAVAEVDHLGGGEGIPEEKKGEEGERRISVPVENLGAEEKEEAAAGEGGEEGETRERGKEEAERTAREEPQPSTTPSRPAQAQAQAEREEEEAAKPLAKEAVAGVAAAAGASVAGAASLAVEGEQQEDEEEDDDDEEEEDDEEESKEEDQESENEKLVVKEPETEDADEQFFKYSPGKLRGSQYKAMMTKEELEDEQRVKREQLTAIFSLLKEKPDTFGEMSETDMKDQLRLYDI
nr:matrix-remodeling-associated protein 7 isoform X2 [Anolis sagrei ordinatus]